MCCNYVETYIENSRFQKPYAAMELSNFNKQNG